MPTLLDDAAAAATAKCVYAYSISKDAATPPELPPILYINQARALGWEAVGGGAGGTAAQYLVPLDTALARPPGANGSIWDVLQSRADLSTAVGLIGDGLPDLQQQLAALPDVVARKGYRTFFVPGAYMHAIVIPVPYSDPNLAADASHIDWIATTTP